MHAGPNDARVLSVTRDGADTFKAVYCGISDCEVPAVVAMVATRCWEKRQHTYNVCKPDYVLVVL